MGRIRHYLNMNKTISIIIVLSVCIIIINTITSSCSDKEDKQKETLEFYDVLKETSRKNTEKAQKALRYLCIR